MKLRVALVPSYEPDFVLLDVVNELLTNDFNVVVVNDGSGPNYDDVFTRLPSEVHYLAYDTNHGKGYALKHGLKYIRDNFQDCIVVTLDSDGQHRVSDAVRICDECENHEENTLVLGSRIFDKKAPFKSRFGNFMARLSFLISTRHKIYDTQTGLRAFDYGLLDRMIDIKGDRYEYEMNVLMELTRDKTMVREVWIETVYLNGNASSHFDTVRDSYRIYREILKFSFSSLVSFCVDYLLFCAFSVSSGTLVLSNVLARICSGTLNYTMNKRFVFGQRGDVARSAAQYLLLAGFLLFCNTTVLKLLAASGVNRYAAKILTELVLFLFSWSVQHRIIFRREGVSE